MKPITKSHIPPRFLFCLEMAGVLEEYLKEANKQNCFWRRKAYEADTFFEFLKLSFWWHETSRDFMDWLRIARGEETL